ncbi:MAG: TonB-dependent receptor, partial [Chitinophagaceae bacterium]
GSTSANEAGTLSYVGRANYAYANKYLAEFLFRTDASTKFAPENYWGQFYSGSVGWVVSEESFFKVPAINYLKIRYAAGVLGNDQTKPWLWRQRYTTQDGKGAVFGGNTASSTGLKMEASPNRDASWSTEYKNNLGIDGRILNNRLSFNVEAYFNAARNILLERTANIPFSVGGTSASENFGSANYYGYELGLNWDDKIGEEFRYGVGVRFGWSDDKVLVGNFNDNDILKPWNPKPGESSDNGKWGYDNLGMFKTADEVTNYVNQYKITQVFGTPATQLKPGTLYYRDVRGALQSNGTFAGPDGIIDENDQIQLTKKASNHYGFGITLKAGYKGFSVDAILAGSFGGWSEIDERKALNVS